MMLERPSSTLKTRNSGSSPKSTGAGAAVDPNPAWQNRYSRRSAGRARTTTDYVVTEDMLERVDNEVVLRGEL